MKIDFEHTGKGRQQNKTRINNGGGGFERYDVAHTRAIPVQRKLASAPSEEQGQLTKMGLARSTSETAGGSSLLSLSLTEAGKPGIVFC